MQVRETIIHFFEMFSRLESASQTVKVFRNEGLLFPSRLSDDRCSDVVTQRHILLPSSLPVYEDRGRLPVDRD